MLVQFSLVQMLSHVQLFATPWTVARQAPLSIANTRSLLKLMSIELVMPTNHLILCHLLLLLPSVFPSIRFFSKEIQHKPKRFHLLNTELSLHPPNLQS